MKTKLQEAFEASLTLAAIPFTAATQNGLHPNYPDPEIHRLWQFYCKGVIDLP